MDPTTRGRFICPCVPEELEEEASLRIPAENRYFFSSTEEKTEVIETGALSELMYKKDFRPLEDILDEVNRDIFEPIGHHLEALATPEALGVTLPPGCSIQAFREVSEGRIFFAIRGTQLDKDPDTKIQNLIADLGIGDLKTPEELNSSIQTVCNHLSFYHNVDLSSPARVFATKAGEVLVQRKVTGTTDSERHQSITSGLVSDAVTPFKWAYDSASTAAITALDFARERPLTAGAVVIAGGAGALVAGPSAVLAGTTLALKNTAALGLYSFGAHAAFRGVVGGLTTLGGLISVKKPSYTILTDYVRGCDNYIMTLKKRGYIAAEEKITVTGHSLGGYLSGVIGAIHADRIVSHNGPGVVFQNDVKKILKTLELERPVRDVIYNSYSQLGDFIGNLFKRSGTASKGLRFACATYPSPLAHHGIRIMNLIYGILPVTTPQVPLAPSDTAVDVASEEATLFSTGTYYTPSALLMLEDEKPSEES